MRKLLRFYVGWLVLASSGAVLMLIIVAAGGLMLFSSFRESAIMDELAHIPAGYGYVRYLDYRLNPEHPPLVKALAAAPLLVLHLNFSEADPSWATAVNGQWDAGTKLLYGSGNDPDKIIRVARLMPIMLTLLLVLLVYYVAKERLGKQWALLPAALTAFSPIVLAHGHYVTTDIGATLGILFALWRFYALLEKPSGKNIFLAGLAFGIAQLLKFSAVLLIPYLVFLALTHWFVNRRSKKFWQYARTCALVFLIGYILVVYPVYALFTAHYPIAKQVSDTQTTLGSFAGGPTLQGENCSAVRCLADLTIWASGHAWSRPLAEYALGVLMVMQRADGGNTAYFLGHVSGTGSRWYFPIVYTLKESLPALIITLLPLMFFLARLLGNIRERRVFRALRTYVSSYFPEFALLGFVVFYWAYSIKSPLNIGVRHILPTLPLMYILSAGFWRRSTFPAVVRSGRARQLIKATGKLVLLGSLVVWVILEAFIAAPHFLSYFNEIGGGTYGGYRYVTDSNYDWGQDLLALRDTLNAHPEIDKIAVDYFGGGSPAYYLGEKAVSWNSAKGDPRTEGIHYIAISINSLEQALQPVAPGYARGSADTYAWLASSEGRGFGGVPKPDLRAGTSIFIYKLPSF